MKTNVGNTDRIVRLVLAAVFVYLAVTVHAAFWIVAIIAAATAALGFCGLYTLFGISTCPVRINGKAQR